MEAPKTRSPNHVPKGFTLLEVLIAAVVLTAGVVAIMWAFNTGLYATTDVENVDLALNIAQAKMEEIKNSAFADLADSGPTADPDFPRFLTTVNVAEGQNPMQVDVTVNWDAKGGQTGFTLSTLIADYSTQ
ncbi:MAG: prepilin-type N-terminal cleavage/methylation domain-containing protein [Candidatus Omnitrophica bacterium]|nr:prepilin-type N-terminal cleavage/methylation domain-containing protein [Candidatus Omnitrophota bacterium]